MPSVEASPVRFVDAGALRIAYEELGPVDGWPVVLLHGFPYDVRAYDTVAAKLAQSHARVIMPYLRGFGLTTFCSPDTMISGQQAALGCDLLALLDSLEIKSALLGGFDWGGRAACIVAALWPERVDGLLSVNGYNIQDIASSSAPAAPKDEYRLWYQYYLHSQRGMLGLQKHRADFCRLLWRLWSPTWRFDTDDYERSARSFENPDFVDVVTHSYRHRCGLADGDSNLEAIERRLADQPSITVPAITLDGLDDGVVPTGFSNRRMGKFTGRHEHRELAAVGHNPPQEAPTLFADLLFELRDWKR